MSNTFRTLDDLCRIPPSAPTPRETADHAELARRLRVSWSDRGWVAANKIKELLGEAREAADALENLLSEIAALRGEVDDAVAVIKDVDRAARQAASMNDAGYTVTVERTATHIYGITAAFLANQGADQ